MLSHTALRTIPFPNPPDQGPDVGTEAFFYGLKLSSCLGGGELIGPSMECDYISGPQFNSIKKHHENYHENHHEKTSHQKVTIKK